MRIIHDQGFQRWEAYATTGEYGFALPARIAFRCLTDPAERPRAVQIDGDKSEAELRVRRLSDDELEELLSEAGVLD